ncbi:hypothetical protein [Amycolatopsis cihanbeyliensis]|uniref:Uncharacterized protein n=1 Tax=Amycolatopsis cihanbeyliensis TaxID=1128664 RepID=A0A542DJU4_AMYCI|nr:hypothetical protein [Amycolatopsis cihanbeyliensis]TQJ03367.1 hypothetical protein FB471_3123 [Amycolatopsis cihanbeyliensis]
MTESTSAGEARRPDPAGEPETVRQGMLRPLDRAMDGTGRALRLIVLVYPLLLLPAAVAVLVLRARQVSAHPPPLRSSSAGRRAGSA